MPRASTVLLVVSTLAFGTASAGLSQPSSTPGQGEEHRPILRTPNRVPGEYIVILKEGVARRPDSNDRGKPSVPEVAREVAAAFNGTVTHTYEHALQGFAVRMPEERARGLANHPLIELVEENGEVQATQGSQFGPPGGLDRIDQRPLPLDGIYSFAKTGTNVNVFVLDTGLRLTHSEFAGRVGAGFTSIIDGRLLSDCSGHGTHVAGTLAGTTYGVAKGVRVHPVRVLDCAGFGSFSQVIAGVDWVTSNTHLRPAVANMSLRGGANTSLDTAVRNSIAAGITYVVAAGNDANSACNWSPARVAEAITVANSTLSDVRNGTSNFGSCVDLFSPGTGILSAWNTSDTATAFLDGTSMASPHVAGIAALFLSSNPTASPASVANAIICKSTKNVVANAGIGTPNRLLFSRFDQADPPTASFSFFCQDLQCSFNAAPGSCDPSGVASYSWTFGDGTSGSGSSVSHAYGAEGTYSVRLTVTSTTGQQAQQTQNVTVFIDPCASDPCACDPCCFDPCCGGLCCDPREFCPQPF